MHLNKFLAVLATTALLAPIIVSAQSSEADLRATIQTSVMSDPRVSQIPPDQLNALIDALVAQAQAQHLTAAEIMWQPDGQLAAGNGAVVQNAACEPGWKGTLCEFNRIFGFEGSSYQVPIFILVVTGLLILVIWELIAHHRKKILSTSTKPV